MALEAIVVPVADVERGKRFYERAGFDLDVDLDMDGLRVVQLTPPGSSCSIILGVGIPQSAPGTYVGLHLVVADVPAARAELIEKGVEVAEPFYFAEGSGEPRPGVHPERVDYGTYATFADPDGNTWVLQEVPRSRSGG